LKSVEWERENWTVILRYEVGAELSSHGKTESVDGEFVKARAVVRELERLCASLELSVRATSVTFVLAAEKSAFRMAVDLFRQAYYLLDHR
jgi:hypothetical protein